MGNSNTETARVEVILNGEKAAATLNEMRAAARALNAELGKIPEPLNSPEYAAGKQKLDDLKSKINDVTGKAKESGDSMKNMLRDVTGLTLGFAGLVAAGMKITSFLKESIQMWMEEERAITKMNFAMGGNVAATDRMLRFVEQLKMSTMFSKDQINSAISMGLELGRTEEQTRKMTETAMGMSRVTGKDLNEMMLALNGTYEGQTGRLGRLAGELKSLSQEQLRNGEGVDILSKKYQKFSSEGINTLEGGINRAGKLFEEFREKIGGAFLKSTSVNAGPGMVFLAWALGIKGDNELDAGRAKIKETLDNIAAMRADAKAHAGDNTYLRDLDKNAEAKHYEDLEKQAQAYQKTLLEIRTKLNEGIIGLITDERDKELTILQRDLEQTLDKIKGNSEQEKKLRADLIDQANQKGAAINARYDLKQIDDAFKTEKAKWEAILKADDQYSLDWLQDSKTLLRKQEEFELSNTKLTEEQKLDIKKKYKALTEALEQSYSSAGTSNSSSGNEDAQAPGSMTARAGVDKLGDGQYDQKRALLKNQYDYEIKLARGNKNEKEKLDNDYYKSLQKINLKEITDWLKLGQAIMGLLAQTNDALNAYENAQLQKDQDANDSKKKNLDARLKAGTLSQKDYDAQIAKMDLEMDVKKRKLAHDQAVRQKEINVMNAIIGLALGIINATNAPPPLDVIMPILIGALGAVQLGLILATPVPALAKGKYDVIGQDDGRSYSADWGGKAQTGIYAKPTLIGEAGPELVVDADTTKILQMNYPWVLGTINHARVAQYATGNYQDSSKTMTTQPIIVNHSDPELMATIKALNEHVQKGIIAYISYDHFIQEQDKINRIQKDCSR